MMEWFLTTRTEVSGEEGGERRAFERRGVGPSPTRPPNFADSDGPRSHWASHPVDFLSSPSLPSSPPPPLSHVLHVHGEGGREREGEDEEMGGHPTRLSRRHPQLSLFSPSPSPSVVVPAPRQEGAVSADVQGAGAGRDAGGGLGSWEREGNEEEREDTLWLASAFVDLDVDAMGYEELLLLGELIGPAKKAGLSPSQVEALPAHPFLPRSLSRHLSTSPGKSCCGGEEGGERGLMCVVCLCEVEEAETVRTLPRCGHRFHGPGCVDVWLESHNSCPVCKAVVVVGGREEGKTAEV
jgi:hypothetical protein